jgi:protein-disulfide isomerase
MRKVFAALGLMALLVAGTALVTVLAHAADVSVPERILGNPSAPVTVEEFVSFTCPHCAEFYTDVLPQLKEAYVDSGKVRFILRDFPLDGTALKAEALARCMPAEEYYPFVSVIFENQVTWATNPDPDRILTQYAKLGGLDGDKAKSCLNDKGMQDALVAARGEATKKYNINATPTFIINGGAERLEGGQTPEKFAAIFDKLLAEQH